MTDQALRRQITKIAKSLVGIDKRVSTMERAAQAKFVSITDGSTTYYDRDGNPVVVIGKQNDGNYTWQDQNGPPLPAPSAPVVDVSTPGMATIVWDGKDKFGSTVWPAHFSHVEVHLLTLPGYVPVAQTEVATFHGTRGGTLTLALEENTYYTKLVAVNTSKVDSVPSEEVEFDVEPPPDPGIQAYYQDDPPTGLDLDDFGSIWYDTNDQNKMHFWDGIEWVDVTDGSLADKEYVDTQVLTSANGKNKVTYSLSTPGSNPNTAGDSWFQFNEINQIIGQWRGTGGTSWTPVTLENAMIATLDAGKINTGFLDVANRINAGSIAIGKVADLQPTLDAKETPAGAQEKATAAEIAAIEAAATNTNATFSNWTSTTPVGFGLWAGTVIKNTTDSISGPNAVEFDVNASTQAGLTDTTSFDPLPLNLEYVTVETKVMLKSGTSFSGSGIFIDWTGMTVANRGYVVFEDIVPTPGADKWYHITKVVRRPTNAAGTQTAWGGYIMANHASLGALSAKNIIFDRVMVRPSTSEEILAYNAPSDAQARVDALQTLWGHPTDTTLIDGGDIYTNSIRAKSLLLMDVNNYLSDPGFIDGTSGRSWILSSGSSITVATGTTPGYVTMNGPTANANAHCGDASYWATEEGTEYNIVGEYSGVATNSGTTTFRPNVNVLNSGGASLTNIYPAGISVTTSTTWIPFSYNITIPADGAQFKWYPFVNGSVANNKVRFRGIKIRRKNAGSLIVDGSIKAEQIDSDQIKTRHIDAGAVKADELDVQVLKAGFTLTGAIQVGQSYWTPEEGLVIPQPGGGVIRLPADGATAARFDGHITAKSATIEGNLNILGGTNKISGTLQLSSGVSEPNVAPAAFQSWPSVYASPIDASGTAWRGNIGMAPHPSNGALFATSVVFGGTAIRYLNASTGAYGAFPDPTQGQAWVSGYFSWGGLGYFSGSYYLYGQDSNRGSAWYIYRINSSTFAKTSEVLVTSDPNFHTDGAPSITVDASTGTVHIFYSYGVEGHDRTYNSSLTLINDVVYNNYGIAVNHMASYVGTADFGSRYHLVAIEETKAITAFNSSLTFDAANSFSYAASNLVRGLYYDSTAARFRSFDRNGNIHTYSSWKTNQAITASYTWYDNVGTVRETREGPAVSYTLPARSHLNIETPPAPDSGNTDAGQVDKANMVKIYVGVGAGARRVQNGGAPLGVDGSGVTIRRLTMDTIATGSATTPASNTFATGSVPTGKLTSGATSGGQPILEISGDGAIKAGTVNGVVIEETAWVSPTLNSASGWSNFGSGFQAARYKRMNGTVYIEGLVVAGTNGTAVFNLPAGFRPSATLMMTGQTNSTSFIAGRFDIQSGGNIVAQGSPVGWLSITCSFQAA